ncbi:MAG: PAS domain S-box protein [Terracidiphilus sp.]
MPDKNDADGEQENFTRLRAGCGAPDFEGQMKEPMMERLEDKAKQLTTRPQKAQGGMSELWLILPFAILAFSAGAALARLFPALRWESLPVMAGGIAAAAFAFLLNRLVVSAAAAQPAETLEIIGEGLKALLDSAGPSVVAIDTEGRLIYCNPAIERLLGYRATELMNVSGAMEAEILGPGEGERLLSEMKRLCNLDKPTDSSPTARVAAFFECVRSLPPSVVPSFDARVRRKNGELVPVTIHISALRDASGQLGGLVAVAMDQSAVVHREQAQRESQERYRDLFEHSSEMIATLSPTGKFLYANPAWTQTFGLSPAALLALDNFEEVFAQGIRNEASALFRCALDGATIERAPLRHHSSEGRLLELEISLSRRQRAGDPLAVRCLLRDVTQQKQRENRLALQLAVSQIVNENAAAESASMRILEALCVSQGWDVAIEWIVDADQKALEFGTAWGTPGRQAEALIQGSMGLTLGDSPELPVLAWKESRAVWLTDISSTPATPRHRAAMNQDMASGWAVPIRSGSRVLGVLEFYSHFRLREDREAMAAVETAAASLGQLLARSQESGRADELSRQQEILLDSVTDGICGLDRNGRVSFANSAAARLLGVPVEGLIGKSAHEILHDAAPPDRACDQDCPIRRTSEAPGSSTGEDNIFRADGGSFPAEYVVTPIRGHGRFLGSVLTFRDISQRYALDQLKDEFISTVSHELRTPLTSIRGALGLLSSGMLGETNEKATNLLRIALTNSDRLVRLINDILDLERIQSGREPLSFKPVQLASVVKQAIDDMQPMADSAGVKLIHDATLVEISADPDRLLQVITNLLSNAVKFSPPNSPVSVMLRPGVTGVILSVIDHGRGIPADKLETIFGRFQQVDASDSRQKGGTGLGLAICRTIVMQHSGRIWAERNPVRGSTFRVFLPYQPALQNGQHSPSEPETVHGTVVLADANPESRPRIAAQLARHGYSVVQAANVEQTLSAARQDAQAILLDSSLDGMNGWEILPLLRRLNKATPTPVVLMSVENPGNRADLPGDTAGWVTKPLRENDLLAELARVLCGSGEKARILVVEDDRDLAHVIKEIFTRDNITVQTAHTLRETVEACSSFRPQLMVLDIGLPDGDGFNVVDYLRQSDDLAGLPLVVYSGRELSQEDRANLTLGPTYFLAKTRVQPQQLEALVLTMLRSSRQTDTPAAPESTVPKA